MNVGITIPSPRLIADSAVTTPKLVDTSITKAKLTSMVSNSTNLTNFTSGSTSYSTVASTSITLSGVRPVIIRLVPRNTSSSNFYTSNSSVVNLRLKVNGTVTYLMVFTTSLESFHTTGSVAFFHVPSSSGSHTFLLEGRIQSGADIEINNATLLAYEL